jgi:2-phospho-L-lactate guanylyltransferase
VSGILAVVPLRDGTSGKTRLAPAFSAEDRATLIAEMGRHVLHALANSFVTEGVLVLTRDPAFVESSLAWIDPTVEAIQQPGSVVGLNAAIAYGTGIARDRGASGVLVIHADLPLLRPEDVRELFDRDASVVIAPDRHRTGTNALLVHFDSARSRDYTYRFGAESYRAHLAEADRLAMSVETAIMTGTEFDLDTVDDWQAMPSSIRAAFERDLKGSVPSGVPDMHALAGGRESGRGDGLARPQQWSNR